MFSGEGENVPFCQDLYPTGNVEDWLLEVERIMRESLKDILNRSLQVYPEVRTPKKGPLTQPLQLWTRTREAEGHSAQVS